MATCRGPPACQRRHSAACAFLVRVHRRMHGRSGTARGARSAGEGGRLVARLRMQERADPPPPLRRSSSRPSSCSSSARRGRSDHAHDARTACSLLHLGWRCDLQCMLPRVVGPPPLPALRMPGTCRLVLQRCPFPGVFGPPPPPTLRMRGPCRPADQRSLGYRGRCRPAGRQLPQHVQHFLQQRGKAGCRADFRIWSVEGTRLGPGVPRLPRTSLTLPALRRRPSWAAGSRRRRCWGQAGAACVQPVASLCLQFWSAAGITRAGALGPHAWCWPRSPSGSKHQQHGASKPTSDLSVCQAVGNWLSQHSRLQPFRPDGCASRGCLTRQWGGCQASAQTTAPRDAARVRRGRRSADHDREWPDPRIHSPSRCTSFGCRSQWSRDSCDTSHPVTGSGGISPWQRGKRSPPMDT